MVRKHLCQLKGGRLAAACPAAVTTFVLSDVVGDDVATVSSGPTLPDPSTYSDALLALERAGGPPVVRAYLQACVVGHAVDTPTLPRIGDSVVLAAGVDSMAQTAAAVVARYGAVAKVKDSAIRGDVVAVAEAVVDWCERIASGEVWVGAGEPTLALPSRVGRGGRAHHLALLVAQKLSGRDGVRVLCAGSDGVDGNSDAAGAIVDGATWQAIEFAGIGAQAALDGFDAATALAEVGASLSVGPTGVNHADLILVARD